MASCPLEVPVFTVHSKGTKQLPSSQPHSREMDFVMENIYFKPGLSGALFHLHCHGFLLHLSSFFFSPLSPLSYFFLVKKTQTKPNYYYSWIFYEAEHTFSFSKSQSTNELILQKYAILLANYFQNTVQYLIVRVIHNGSMGLFQKTLFKCALCCKHTPKGKPSGGRARWAYGPCVPKRWSFCLLPPTASGRVLCWTNFGKRWASASLCSSRCSFAEGLQKGLQMLRSYLTLLG